MIRGGSVLLQLRVGDPVYVFPARLLWVGETFFPWGERPCHPVGLYYLIELVGETQIPLTGSFNVTDSLLNTNLDVEFNWLPLSALGGLEIYPVIARERLLNLSGGIEHFIYRE